MRHGDISPDVAQGIKVLRERIAKAGIPSSKLDESLNLATWNIREFGRKPRTKASIHYIAEIIHQFDIVALTEVRRELEDLSRVMDLLGPYWKVVFSDYIADWGGNWERTAFVYDKRMAVFTGLAAEADPFRSKNEAGEYVSEVSWWRAPYMASFRAGSFDFIILCSHCRWGHSKAHRAKPLLMLAEWLQKRTKDGGVYDKDFILLGDFNIPQLDDELFQAITSRGLEIPTHLRNMTVGTNLTRNRRYDQIFYNPKHTAELVLNGGVLDFLDEDSYDSVEDAIRALYPHTRMSKSRFTYQISDHLPLWVQLNTDVEDEEIEQILNRAHAA